jgi:plasmid stabilization system protein ParE
MTIYLSLEAQKQLANLLDYLEFNWSIKVRDNFLEKLTRSLQVIESMPEAFPASEKMPSLRRCVVTPQTILYYQIQTEVIEVISIIDARQDI